MNLFQETKVAVGIHGGSLNHEMVPFAQSWLSQVFIFYIQLVTYFIKTSLRHFCKLCMASLTLYFLNLH